MTIVLLTYGRSISPRYVHKDSYQSVTDDKSGYDHITSSLLRAGPSLVSSGVDGIL